MAVDPFEKFAESPMAPASDCFAVSPSDADELPRVPKALYVGTAGDVNIVAVASETPVVLRNVTAGSILPIRVARVLASGTTADHIVGLG